MRASFLLALGMSLFLACPTRPKFPADGKSSGTSGQTQKQIPQIPENGPLAQKIFYEQAKGLLRSGKTQPAVELFQRALEAHPDGELAANCYLGLASAYGDLRKPQDAVAAYQKVVSLRPKDAEAYRALAIGQEEAGQIPEARASLEQSLSLDPYQLSAYQDLAALYLRTKELEEAKTVYLQYELHRTHLIKTLGLSKDEAEREAAAIALGDARDEATCKALGLALTNKSAKVRWAVIRALGQQGLAIGAGPLKELHERTNDPEEKRLIHASLEAIQHAPQPGAQPFPGASSSGALPPGVQSGSGSVPHEQR